MRAGSGAEVTPPAHGPGIGKGFELARVSVFSIGCGMHYGHSFHLARTLQGVVSRGCPSVERRTHHPSPLGQAACSGSYAKPTCCSNYMFCL